MAEPYFFNKLMRHDTIDLLKSAICLDLTGWHTPVNMSLPLGFLLQIP
jgi:hypothetical protein